MIDSSVSIRCCNLSTSFRLIVLFLNLAGYRMVCAGQARYLLPSDVGSSKHSCPALWQGPHFVFGDTN